MARLALAQLPKPVRRRVLFRADSGGGTQGFLARLAARGALSAGPAPLPLSAGTAIEVDRMVNGCGLTCLAGAPFNARRQLAGQRITLRMDGPLMTLIDATGTELRTMPCPVPPAGRTGCAAPAAPSSPPGQPAR